MCDVISAARRRHLEELDSSTITAIPPQFIHVAVTGHSPMGDLFNLPVPLTYLVGQKFKDAEASKNLTFSPTELTTIHTAAGIPVRF